MALLEVCANSIQSALNAQSAGAQRIELCQDLESGGLTPSYGLVSLVRSKLKIPVHVLIRPRKGNFVYDEHEFQIMLADVEACRSLLCDGVAIGVLTKDGRVDKDRLSVLMQAAKPMSVTFHRAFDDCVDQFEALEDLAAMLCDRILTSGGEDNVEVGAERIKDLVGRANGRLIIMPGCGLTAVNVRALSAKTGAREFHASGSHVLSPSTQRTIRSRFDANIRESNVDTIRNIVGELSNL